MDLRRIVRGIRWRILDETPWVILAAGPLPTVPDVPPTFSLVRLFAGHHPPLDVADAEHAMRASGSTASVRERLDAGHEFFGWRQGNTIASFGWASHRSRIFGVQAARAAPHRAFTFHFHTFTEFRGLGLCPALIEHIRYAMGREGKTEFICDVQARNTASLRASEKAGYTPVAYTTVQTFFMRFERERNRTLLDRGTKGLGPIW